jgi:hypothetical protein
MNPTCHTPSFPFTPWLQSSALRPHELAASAVRFCPPLRLSQGISWKVPVSALYALSAALLGHAKKTSVKWRGSLRNPRCTQECNASLRHCTLPLRPALQGIARLIFRTLQSGCQEKP